MHGSETNVRCRANLQIAAFGRTLTISLLCSISKRNPATTAKDSCSRGVYSPEQASYCTLPPCPVSRRENRSVPAVAGQAALQQVETDEGHEGDMSVGDEDRVLTMNSAPSMAAGVWLVVSPGIPAYAEHACLARGRPLFDSIGILRGLCLNGGAIAVTQRP